MLTSFVIIFPGRMGVDVTLLPKLASEADPAELRRKVRKFACFVHVAAQCTSMMSFLAINMKNFYFLYGADVIH